MEQVNQTPFPPQPSPGSGNVGPLAAAVVIVILLALGGFYFFSTQESTEPQAQDAALQNTSAQNDSADSIEADLNATQTGGAEADVDDLEGSL
jgi:uncharacterized protein HemX